MSKINQVIIYLDVSDINETARFYETIFGFQKQVINDEIIRLEKANCALMISKVDEPIITTFGLSINNIPSLIENIEAVDIEHNYDSAKSTWEIKDYSGNTIVLVNNN